MYEILTGKQRGLVFPVMCNGHVVIDYRDNIADTENDTDTTNDVAYGLWAHEDSFTFESIITPYEINGYGTYSSLTKPTYTSKKSSFHESILQFLIDIIRFDSLLHFLPYKQIAKQPKIVTGKR